MDYFDPRFQESLHGGAGTALDYLAGLYLEEWRQREVDGQRPTFSEIASVDENFYFMARRVVLKRATELARADAHQTA